MRGLAEEPAVRIDLHALLGEIAADRRDAGGDASPAPTNVPILVACRPVMLRRAVTNLVDDAVRHGGGTAELSVRREPFRRLEGSRSRATGGTGLGLTLARSVARRHGGDVTLARADDGPGLVATLRLPDG